MNCTLGSDGDVVDGTSGDWRVRHGVVKAQLRFRWSEVLNVNRRKLVAVLLANNVAELAPGEINLERGACGCVIVLERTAFRRRVRRHDNTEERLLGWF